MSRASEVVFTQTESPVVNVHLCFHTHWCSTNETDVAPSPWVLSLWVLFVAFIYVFIAYMYVHTRTPEDNLKCLPFLRNNHFFCFVFWSRASSFSLNFPSSPGWLASNPRPAISASPVLRSQMCTTTPVFLVNPFTHSQDCSSVVSRVLTSVEPVNAILSMPIWEAIAAPAVGPYPGRILTTPGGKPA